MAIPETNREEICGTENNEKWEGDRTGRNCSGGLRVLGRREGVPVLDLLQRIFEHEKMSEGWSYCVLAPIVKYNGELQDCEQYRRIKIMNHPVKICEAEIDRMPRAETRTGEDQLRLVHIFSMTDSGEAPGDAEETVKKCKM